MSEGANNSSDWELDSEQVSKSLSALYKFVEKKADNSLGRSEVLKDTDKILLQICYKKVPTFKEPKTVKIILPHSLLDKNSDVCLFVPDLKTFDDNDEMVEHYKEMLSKEKITPLPEIITHKSLRTEFKPYEAKRALSNTYDHFLCDASIFHRIPKLLGKHFFARNRKPTQINLKKKIKREFTAAYNTVHCHLKGRGSTCSLAVGNTRLTVDQCLENILLSVKKIAPCLPGGAVNIRSIHVRIHDSPAIPIYYSDGLCNEVELPKRKRSAETAEFEDITTFVGGKVRVTGSGKIEIQLDEKSEENEEEGDGEVEGEEDEEGDGEEGSSDEEQIDNDVEDSEESESEDLKARLKKVKASKSKVKSVDKKKAAKRKTAKKTELLEEAFLQKRQKVAEKTPKTAKTKEGQNDVKSGKKSIERKNKLKVKANPRVKSHNDKKAKVKK